MHTASYKEKVIAIRNLSIVFYVGQEKHET